jgi:carbon monoxide dehydrogenase subunit G
MFIISADYSEKIEVKAPLADVAAFLNDLQNFVKYMPHIEGIHTDAKGVAHWSIAVEVPVVGQMRQTFPVEMDATPPDEIEWVPAAGEKQNFFRYLISMMEKSPGITVVQISQKVELRRDKPRHLHLLAGVAGESLISSEMKKSVTHMIKEFLQKGREILEK